MTPGVVMWRAEDGSLEVRRRASVPAAAAIIVMVLAVMGILLPGAVAQEPDGLGDAGSGRQLFASNCAACHGASAEVRGGTPALIGVHDHLSVEEVETIIREGRGSWWCGSSSAYC